MHPNFPVILLSVLERVHVLLQKLVCVKQDGLDQHVQYRFVSVSLETTQVSALAKVHVLLRTLAHVRLDMALQIVLSQFAMDSCQIILLCAPLEEHVQHQIHVFVPLATVEAIVNGSIVIPSTHLNLFPFALAMVLAHLHKIVFATLVLLETNVKFHYAMVKWQMNPPSVQERVLVLLQMCVLVKVDTQTPNVKIPFVLESNLPILPFVVLVVHVSLQTIVPALLVGVALHVEHSIVLLLAIATLKVLVLDQTCAIVILVGMVQDVKFQYVLR